MRRINEQIAGLPVVGTREYVGANVAPDLYLCSLAEFIKNYLPFEPKEGDVAKAVECLLEAGHLEQDLDTEHECLSVPPTQPHITRYIDDTAGAQPTEPQLRWSGFERHPAAAHALEKITHKPFVDIFKTMAEVDVDSRAANFELVYEPNKPPKSELGGSGHIPHSYLRPIERTLAIPEGPVAEHIDALTTEQGVVFELKRLEKWADVKKNWQQLLGDAVHVLHADPCRLFVYGISIEDARVAVWHVARDRCMRSRSFEFTKNPHMFVRIILSFIFATPNEMGFDPTVHRQDDNGWYRYIYEIPEGVTTRYFQTKRALFEYHGARPTGRATRVWEVIEVDGYKNPTALNPDHSVVLKDVWLDISAQTERQIQDALFAKLQLIAKGIQEDRIPPEIKDFHPSAQNKLLSLLKEERYRDHFVNIESDWQGYTTRDPPAAERIWNIFDQYPINAPHTSRATPIEASIRGTDAISLPAPEQVPIPNGVNLGDQDQYLAIVPPRKRQYRAIKTEVCTEVGRLDDLNEVYQTIMDGLLGYHLMYLAGYIHRDISTGNLLLFKPDGEANSRGLVNDLEYAKLYTDTSDPGVQTGTPHFMALEIHSNTSLRQPTSGQHTNFIDNEDFDQDDDMPVAAYKTPATRTVVKHDWTHDLESFFWIFTWFHVLALCVHEGSDPLTSTLSRWRSMMFAHVDRPTEERKTCFKDSGIFAERLESVTDHRYAVLAGRLVAMLRSIYAKQMSKEEGATQLWFAKLFFRIWQHGARLQDLAKPFAVKVTYPVVLPPKTSTDVVEPGRNKRERESSHEYQEDSNDNDEGSGSEPRQKAARSS